MRKLKKLGQRKHTQWQREKDRENLESYELGEGLVDIATVAVLYAIVFKGDPDADTHHIDVCIYFDISRLKSMDLSKKHERDIDCRISTVIEEQLLER